MQQPSRYKEYARACQAMARAMGAAQTWQQIVETGDALMHLHLRFSLLDRECLRHEQEQGSVAPPVAKDASDD